MYEYITRTKELFLITHLGSLNELPEVDNFSVHELD